ncbi:HSP18 transcriptional regulator [Labedaea rhizosphaerae]|uniref:HSP18 transcriptional regulator n=1 Tax=Labedaea rhizosphaerae TaxID=598644 RepID=A0A4R6SDV7_LABRH|nr:HSP18 transcriptional regulator [Labedaea rhizosphaerae]TDP97823.1 hypothetical protein EV186_103800 [Labedaea rhizosphaerae]
MTDVGDTVARVERIVDGAAEQTREQLLWALNTLRLLRDELATWEPELITAARSAGTSWAELAPALGVASRQAAERRYLRLRPSDTGATTGEARVAAERGKRAADRAVASWARENSAALRMLAGQVSAVTGLDAAGTRSTSQVAEALGHHDPATLLGPLDDAREHLVANHSDLAERISEVTQQTGALRLHVTRTRDPK